MKPRPLKQQTLVITGASSGIGRETAVEAGRRGANVVLAARNETGLRAAAREVEAAGGRVLVVPTDVADKEQVERLAGAAVEHFGRVDTWVNNASVSTYALIDQTSNEEIERVLQVNLLGTIYGCKAVLPYLKAQEGGTIINVASGLGERAVPLQAAYCAAKAAVKGFTESLRMELAREKTGINVTLILPSSINTPFFNHARSKMGVKPQPVPPAYDPRVVAEAILFAAENPRRELYAGFQGKMLAMLSHVSNPLMDWYMVQGGRMFKQQQSDQPDDGRDNLFAPIDEPGRARGDFASMTMGVSPYTRYLEQHPNRKRVAAAALIVGAAVLFARRNRG
jgi:short-subunit dehydrogenase